MIAAFALAAMMSMGLVRAAVQPSVHVAGTPFVGEMGVRRGVARALAPARVISWSDLHAIRAAPGDIVVHSYFRPGEAKDLLALKARTSGRLRLIAIGDPGPDRNDFDLVIQPHHHAPIPALHHGRRLRVIGLPSPISRADLDELPSNRFLAWPSPRVVALIGGRTAGIAFGEELAIELGRLLGAARSGGTLMITNSRRTPHASFAALMAEAKPEVVVDARRDAENPYLELLAAADHVIVTGDSSSMISDALVTGKPVHLYAPRVLMEERHLRFNLPLVESGRVRLLRSPLATWVPASSDVIVQIRRRCADWLTSETGT